MPVYGGSAEMKEVLSRFINVDAVIWCEFKADYPGGKGPETEEAPYLRYLFRCAFLHAPRCKAPRHWLQGTPPMPLPRPAISRTAVYTVTFYANLAHSLTRSR